MRLPRSLTTLFFVFSLSMLSAGAVAAQGATTGATPGGPSEGHPVTIHEGTCANPTAEPAFDIGNANGVGVDQDNPEALGQQAGAPVLQASGKADIKLDDLGNQLYVLAVHASPDDYATIVACGQIAGIKADGKVVIALAPVGSATVVGISTFDSDSSGALGLGSDQIQVTAYIFDTASTTMATPVATPQT